MIPTSEPKRIVKGDTIQWTRSFAGYDPAIWSLTYGFSNATHGFTVDGADRGDGTWLLRIAPDASANLSNGKYRWHARVTDNTDVFTVAEQPIGEFVEVIGAAGTALDLRYQLEKDLEAIEAYLAGKSDVASYTIRDRSLARYTHAELWQMRQELKRAIEQERKAQQIEAGLGTSGKVRVRFR